MNPRELRKLIDKGESEKVAFKSGKISPDLVARTVCAFLNRGGGKLLIGVGDKGQILGVANAGAISRQIESRLPELISPRTIWTIEQIHTDKKEVILVEVPEGKDKPYVTEGSIYVRRGIQIKPATRAEISALILKRSEESQRWERQIAIGVEKDDLDEEIIHETAQMAVASERWQGSPKDIEGFLNAHGLIANGGVTNAGLLLFGRQPTRILPQARVRLLVMPEGKTGDHYSVDRSFDGCILRVAEQIPHALEMYAGGVTSSFSEKSWQREDRPLYPVTALREGIMNALIHRDYDHSGSIIISISPDSLRISNPGGLPAGLKPADLKRDHPSVPRNPDIAHVCFLRQLIEKIGRGTQRIVEDCRKLGLRAPKWQSSDLETTLTFFASIATATGIREEDLNERQRKIITALHDKKQLRSGEVAELIGSEVTGRTVRNDLQTLVDEGWLVRRGRGRGTYYVLGPAEQKGM